MQLPIDTPTSPANTAAVGRTHVRQLWKAKLEGRTLPAPTEPMSLRRVTFVGLVLGIDPSLRATGLALLEFSASPAPPRILTSETVRVSPRESAAAALASIHRAVTAMLALGAVRHVALEQSIFVQNHKTALILGSARGAAIAAVALQDIPVFEYPPLRVKEAVVGIGRASKEQVARTVRAHAGLGAILAWDQADAAAVALCHAFTYRE